MSRLIKPILRKPAPGVNCPPPEQARPAQKGGPAEHQSRAQHGQGMVEFALVLPLLLLLIFGIMELGRLMVIYTAVHAASREGARYGSAAGRNEVGVYYFLDTDGITAAARRIATLVGADIESITYDSGPGTLTFTPTIGDDVSLGDRISVTVRARYDPILGLTPLQPFDIRSTTSRTIVKEVAIGPSGHGSGGGFNFPPEVLIIDPVQPPGERYWIQEGDPLIMLAEANDPEQGDISSTIEWFLDEELYDSCSGGSCSMLGLSRGEHSILALVTDSAGMTASDSLEIFVDPYPVVTILDPVNNQHFYPSSSNYTRTITFTGQASEFYEGDLSSSIHWENNGVEFGIGSSINVSTMDVGLHTITARVADSRGQTASTTISIVIDVLTPPSLVISWPPNNSRFPLGEEITFSATAYDAPDGNLTASISWSDGLGTGPTVRTDSLSEGWHTITASVTDFDMMTTTANVDVRVIDNQPPNIRINSPLTGDVYFAYQGDTITFSATADDDIDGDLSANIQWFDNGVRFGDGASFQFSSLSRGTHNIIAWVQDRQGLSNQAMVVVFIENAPPVVTITAPANNSYFSDQQNVTLSGIATDPGVGDISNTIVWTSTLNTALGTNSSITTDNLSVGVHSIRAFVQDPDGLWDDDTRTLTIWQCPAPGATVWTYQNASSADAVTWSLTIPAGTPRPPTYYLNYLSITRPVGSNVTVSSITVEGLTVTPQLNGSTFEVLNPVWSGNFRPDPDNKIEVRFNFSSVNRPAVNSGPYILTASFTGCSSISVSSTVPPRP